MADKVTTRFKQRINRPEMFVMPGGFTGYDVARRAKEIDPKIRILLTSGYAEDLLRAENLGSLKLLRKPYRLADLRQALETIFSEPP